jgi:hypothetical protein
MSKLRESDMPNAEHLNKQLFHGTSHWFSKGDTVDPTLDFHATFPGEKAAYASDDLTIAKEHAVPRGDNDRLFYPVFPVEPMADNSDARKNIYRSTKGFKVTGNPAGYTTWKDHEERYVPLDTM